jgi:hypothetical protein
MSMISMKAMMLRLDQFLAALVRTVRNTISKQVVRDRGDRRIDHILEHNVLCVLGANAAHFQQTKTGL